LLFSENKNLNTQQTEAVKRFIGLKKNQSSSTNNTKKNYTLLKSNITLNNYFISKIKVSSNASRKSFQIKNPLPLQSKYKKFFFCQNYTRGRSKSGILCRTKGKLLVKKHYPTVNNSFRILYLSFISGFFTVPLKLKTFSLVTTSAGTISYVSGNYTHTLFKVVKMQSVFFKKTTYKNFFYLSKFIKIPQIFFLIIQLPKYKFINSLETYPKKGIQYVKSQGSKALINKIDPKLHLSLVKLPSGVHKVFSIYSVGSEGQIPFITKNLKRQSNAGFFKKQGKKSLSRGVAKNPVDHPHGGRNKAIKYQRTP